VADLSLERLRELDVGGEPVPTLSEVLDLSVGKVLLVMEIKQAGIEAALAGAVHQKDALGAVMAWSFLPLALEGMRQAEPRVPCGLLVSPQSIPRWPEARDRALELGVQAVSVFFSGITGALAGDCRLSGLSLYAWTADAEAEIARLIGLGIDGVCTNYPDRAVKLLSG
jgi:glycerophosphoryl diester phosphodiesterase